MGLMKKALGAMLLILWGAGTSSAVPILVSQTQILTLIGEDMSFSFLGLPTPDASGGTITIAPGGATGVPGLDLSGAFPLEDENFEVTFDGASQGFFSCGGPSNNGSTSIAGAIDNSFNFNDCVFTLPFAVGGPTLASLLADNTLVVGVLFGDDVSTFSHNDEVTVTLSYTAAEVPEPGTLALLGGGLAALRFSRRRKGSAPTS